MGTASLRSLGGDLLKLALSVRQSHVKFLGAGHDSFSERSNKDRARSEVPIEIARGVF